MKKPRRKADYTAAILVKDSSITRRAVDIRVRGNDVYAGPPHKGPLMKFSYHASGRYHLKTSSKSGPVMEIQKVPPAQIGKAEDLCGIAIATFSRLPPYHNEDYDETFTLDVEDLPRRRLALAISIGRDFSGVREQYPPDSEETVILQRILREEYPRICVLARVKRGVGDAGDRMRCA